MDGVGLGVGACVGLVVGAVIVVVGVGSGPGFEHAERRVAARIPVTAALAVERRFVIGLPPLSVWPAS